MNVRYKVLLASLVLSAAMGGSVMAEFADITEVREELEAVAGQSLSDYRALMQLESEVTDLLEANPDNEDLSELLLTIKKQRKDVRKNLGWLSKKYTRLIESPDAMYNVSLGVGLLFTTVVALVAGTAFVQQFLNKGGEKNEGSGGNDGIVSAAKLANSKAVASGGDGSSQSTVKKEATGGLLSSIRSFIPLGGGSGEPAVTQIVINNDDDKMTSRKAQSAVGPAKADEEVDEPEEDKKEGDCTEEIVGAISMDAGIDEEEELKTVLPTEKGRETAKDSILSLNDDDDSSSAGPTPCLHPQPGAAPGLGESGVVYPEPVEGADLREDEDEDEREEETSEADDAE